MDGGHHSKENFEKDLTASQWKNPNHGHLPNPHSFKEVSAMGRFGGVTQNQEIILIKHLGPFL